MNEFMDLVLGDLSGNRLQVVMQAFEKLDNRQMGFVPYQKVKDTFDGKKHPEVANGRKSEQEIITDFLEVYEIHHNTYNDYKKSDKVSRDEFIEYYRTLSAQYDDDLTFISMVKGVWNVKFEMPDVSQMGFAGGNDTAQNSRDRYVKANSQKPAPFGTSQGQGDQQWKSSKDSDYGQATKY